MDFGIPPFNLESMDEFPHLRFFDGESSKKVSPVLSTTLIFLVIRETFFKNIDGQI